MSSLKRRLESLEGKAGGGVPNVSAIVRRFVRPGSNGPIESGYANATIIVGQNNGQRLDREKGESQKAFEQRVKALTRQGQVVPDAAA